MTYNTKREQMPLPEYGREVFQMIKHCTTIPDRRQRQRCAETIVGVMASINPELREQPNYKQLIWDHLAYIADYKLDIDYPYPITKLVGEAAKPTPLKYPTNRIKQRHYGHLIESFLKRLAEMPEGKERDEVLAMIANQMKQSLFNWNRDVMDNEKIAADIAEYTHGNVELDLRDFRFGSVRCMPRQDTIRKKKRK